MIRFTISSHLFITPNVFQPLLQNKTPIPGIVVCLVKINIRHMRWFPCSPNLRQITQKSIENVYLPESIIYRYSVQIFLCQVDVLTFSNVKNELEICVSVPRQIDMSGKNKGHNNFQVLSLVTRIIYSSCTSTASLKWPGLLTLASQSTDPEDQGRFQCEHLFLSVSFFLFQRFNAELLHTSKMEL